jgi:dTDP-4-amino-4,6-dideoxygalactose transaminase
MYSGLSSANAKKLSVAEYAANKVLCLPVHASLAEEDLYHVVQTIKGKK